MELTTNLLPQMTELWQQTMNWQPTAAQQAQFEQLYELILEGNQQLNLTRITQPQEFWEKHLWDSLRGVAKYLTPDSTPLPVFKVIDIGTGGGFPGVPVAITFPNSQVTLLDSTRKKVVFLQKLVAALGLTNVKTVTGRAEAVGQQPQHRGQYDLALIRAVGVASVCAEYALPMLKQGGVAVLYRGTWTDEETTTLQGAVQKLGGVIEAIDTFATPLSGSDRTCLYLKKVAPTPTKYPRGVGIPTQQPL